MVQAWYMAENWSGNPQEEHHKQPPEYVDLDTLNKLTLVEHFKINEPAESISDEFLTSIKKDHVFSSKDVITLDKEYLPNYEIMLKKFYEEHLHTEDEMRLFLEGTGFFDVRDVNDAWIRIRVEPGDFLIVPKGCYHRFTLDANNFCKIKRWFGSGSVWTSHNRPADQMECRREYLSKILMK